MEITFHVEIGLPAGFRAPTHTVSVDYSAHALQAAQTDRYGTVYLPARLNLSDFKVIEATYTDNRLTKLLVRGELDDRLDICFVLVPGYPGNRKWRCKTVWINERSDSHRTLDRSKYGRP